MSHVIDPPQSDKPSRNRKQTPHETIQDLPPVPLEQRITMLAAVVFPFLGVIIAIATAWQYGWMGWQYLAMLIGGWILTGLGITVGFHRLLSHRAFETYGPIRAFWMTLGSMAVEGSPLVWTAVHRAHHAFSDHEGDPHSPHLAGKGIWNRIRGFMHAHFGWLIFNSKWTYIQLEKYAPDMVKDKWIMFGHRHYGWFVLASLVIPTALGFAVSGTLWGAWLGFLWGGLVRVFVTHHITWSINSICHIFGSREYESNDHSTNNFICGLLGLGEGWHNNHHAFPNSARQGLRWWQFDLSWIVIRTMQLTGLAWNVKLPTEKLLETKRLRPAS